MKICTFCKIEKPFTEFSPRKDRKDGLHFYCRLCLKEKKAESYQRNREKALAAMAAYRKANPEKVAATKKKCYEAKPEQYAAKAKARYKSDPEKFKARAKAWYEGNREFANVRGKIYNEKNKEHARIRNAAYREANRAEINAKSIQRQKDNREAYNAYQLAYRLRRYKEDPLYALEATCRRRVLCAMGKGGYRKSTKTENLIGCSYQFLKAYLEALFLPGMTWENRGLHGWHLDHIVPMSSAKTAEDIERLCHYTNLQPLWAKDNWAKGARMPEEWQAKQEARHG